MPMSGRRTSLRRVDVNRDPVTLRWAQKHICPQIIGGWLWYCAEHDTHGNATDEDEARTVAAAHAAYFSDDEVGEVCQMSLWARTRPGPRTKIPNNQFSDLDREVRGPDGLLYRLVAYPGSMATLSPFRRKLSRSETVPVISIWLETNGASCLHTEPATSREDGERILARLQHEIEAGKFSD